jgi:ribose 1,5-bisphosphokinase
VNVAIKNFIGTLFLVVGNSGSGKDSIISGSLKKYPKELKEIHVPNRVITRPPSEFETNIYVSPDKFKQMAHQGKFALKWHIYGLDYGIPIEIDEYLKKGHSIIVNVSRTIIDDARSEYANLRVIFIKVPFEVTVQRIKQRDRESEEGLNERIKRAQVNQTLPKADFIVDNSGNLEDAIEQFLAIVIKVVKENE